jgi:hypothetical protein
MEAYRLIGRRNCCYRIAVQVGLALKCPAGVILVDEFVEGRVAANSVEPLSDQFRRDEFLETEDFFLAAVPEVLHDRPVQQGAGDVVTGWFSLGSPRGADHALSFPLFVKFLAP